MKIPNKLFKTTPLSLLPPFVRLQHNHSLCSVAAVLWVSFPVQAASCRSSALGRTSLLPGELFLPI